MAAGNACRKLPHTVSSVAGVCMLLIDRTQVIGEGLSREVLSAWAESEYEGGRHQRRVDQITALEVRVRVNVRVRVCVAVYR